MYQKWVNLYLIEVKKLLRAIAQLRGLQVGFEAAEAFMLLGERFGAVSELLVKKRCQN